MSTTISIEPRPQQKIILRKEIPFSFLNRVYPSGIPVENDRVSFSGLDCYIFSPPTPPPLLVKTLLSAVIASDAYPELLFHKLWQHHELFIPEYWVQDELFLIIDNQIWASLPTNRTSQ